MKKQIASIFTDATNRDYDYAKVFGTLGIVIFLGISFYSFGIRDAAFNPIEWATGFSIILASAAGVSKLRDRSGVEQPKESAP